MRGVVKRSFRLVACSVPLGVVGVTLAAGSAASAGTLCVQPNKPGCHATIQAALDAAHDGDTIELAAGIYAGPITIAKSIRLVVDVMYLDAAMRLLQACRFSQPRSGSLRSTL